MPGLDGFALTRFVLTRISVVCQSFCCRLRAGDEARIEGTHAGANDYLIKPFSA